MESFASKLQQFAQLLEPIETEVTSAKQEVADLELRLGVAVTRLNEAQRKQSDILGQVFALGRTNQASTSKQVEVDIDSDKQRLFSSPVDVLGLCVRTVNCLKAAEIYFIGDLVQRDVPTLSNIPNLGRKDLSEIMDAFLIRNLSPNMKFKGRWQRPNVPKDN